ncbi:MAG: proton-conducting transporter transmembrane domain-containing protein [Pararhodobacter sp.]
MSALVQGSLWPLLVLVWPLLLGLVPLLPAGGRLALRVLPLAPLPALGFALAGAPGTVRVPDLLLDVQLGAGLTGMPGGALLIGMVAMVWAVAGWQAALSMAPGPQTGILAGFWCLTLAGNLGVLMAGDAVTFYVAFAAVSLAAWFLVVHDRTGAALHAGRVYIILAVLGEAALLAGLILAAQAAGSTGIGAMRAALTEGATPALALMVAGFGIKAGMVPLHVWLPLAHPAAPVPGSAVLSGAIVKAGLAGMLVFLPPGTAMAALVLVLGLTGAYGAALWGLAQGNIKAALAWSTISQMGLMLALAATGAGAAAVAWALHHGLAKGALFLAVGVMAAALSPRQRLATLALAGAIAASVAGLPPTGGALMKAAAKGAASPGLALAITASGTTTALILVWVIALLARGKAAPGPSWPLMVAGLALLGGLALGLPWGLASARPGLDPGYLLTPAALAEALLPLAVGLVLFVLLRRLLPLSLPWQPRLPRLTALRRPPLAGRRLRRPGLSRSSLSRSCLRYLPADRFLRHWPAAGSLMALTVLVMVALLMHA